jgi:hypothetical protein
MQVLSQPHTGENNSNQLCSSELTTNSEVTNHQLKSTSNKEEPFSRHTPRKPMAGLNTTTLRHNEVDCAKGHLKRMSNPNRTENLQDQAQQPDLGLKTGKST